MDPANWWLVDLIGPPILLIVLILLVIHVRENRNGSDNLETRHGTRAASREEDEQRRDGTDQR
jgi:hypothetical protein